MGGRLLEPSPGAERVVFHEGAHIGALRNELFNEMGANKANSISDNYSVIV